MVHLVRADLTSLGNLSGLYDKPKTVEPSLTVFLLYLVNKLVVKRQQIIINAHIIYNRLLWSKSAS